MVHGEDQGAKHDPSNSPSTFSSTICSAVSTDPQTVPRAQQSAQTTQRCTAEDNMHPAILVARVFVLEILGRRGVACGA